MVAELWSWIIISMVVSPIIITALNDERTKRQEMLRKRYPSPPPESWTGWNESWERRKKLEQERLRLENERYRLFNEIARLNAELWNDIWTFECDHPAIKAQAHWWEQRNKQKDLPALMDKGLFVPGDLGGGISKAQNLTLMENLVEDLESMIEKRIGRRSK